MPCVYSTSSDPIANSTIQIVPLHLSPAFDTALIKFSNCIRHRTSRSALIKLSFCLFDGRRLVFAHQPPLRIAMNDRNTASRCCVDEKFLVFFGQSNYHFLFAFRQFLFVQSENILLAQILSLKFQANSDWMNGLLNKWMESMFCRMKQTSRIGECYFRIQNKKKKKTYEKRVYDVIVGLILADRNMAHTDWVSCILTVYLNCFCILNGIYDCDAQQCRNMWRTVVWRKYIQSTYRQI